MKVWKKKLFFIGVMIFGLAVAGTPFFSFLWGDVLSDRKVSAYEDSLSALSEEKVKAMKDLTAKYEASIDPSGGSIVDPFVQEDYVSGLFDRMPVDVYGYLAIPRLEVVQPIYLGADSQNLLKGVAQVEGTSFPGGGEGSHCVIAGHRGNHRVDMMFRHLDRLEKGDKVYVYTPDNGIAYTVTESEVILPSQNDKLLPVPGQDRLTLLTCTPYPVNDKRLLVTCQRSGTPPQGTVQSSIQQVMEETSPDPVAHRSNRIQQVLAPVFAGGILLLVGLAIKVWKNR